MFGWELDEIFYLQKVHQTIVEEVHRFVCESKFREIVAGQGSLCD